MKQMKTKVLTMDLTTMKTSLILGDGTVTSRPCLVVIITIIVSVALIRHGLQLRACCQVVME